MAGRVDLGMAGTDPAAATPADLAAARMQMALSLGWHIVVACLGLSLLAHWDPNAVIAGLNEVAPTDRRSTWCT